MELTRTDAVFSRIAMVLFYVQKTNILGMTWNSTEHLRKNNKKSSPKMKTRGPTPCPRGGGARPLPRGPPGAPSTSTPTPYIHVLREKKSERRIHRVLWYGTAAKPNLSREVWSGVRSGLQRGESIAIVIINHPPSPISWCSPPCVSNPIVGLLDGDGLDDIYHVIKLVLIGYDP